MRRWMAGLLIVAALPAQDVAGRLDAHLAAWDKLGRFQGAVLVAQGDRVLVRRGYGLANVEWEIPNSPDTRYRLGSLTKQFTAASILLLQEQGKLSVNDSVTKYFADAPPSWKAVTIHHLLSHGSGIVNFTAWAGFDELTKMRVTGEELYHRVRDWPLEFTPGSKYAYSNSGYFLLGMIIEKASGLTYEDFVAKYLFAPLGMESTGYDHADRIIKKRATGYTVLGQNAAYVDTGWPFAAGALYSTVDDLFRWERALFGGRVLKPESFTAMTSKQNAGYGYGLGISETYVGHEGGINGFRTVMLQDPAKALTVIVLGNSELPAGRLGRELLRIATGETVPVPVERRAVRLNSPMMDRYVGPYRLPDGRVVRMRRVGLQMYLDLPGLELPIFATDDSHFFAKQLDWQVEVVLNEMSMATELLLTIDGQTVHAARLDPQPHEIGRPQDR